MIIGKLEEYIYDEERCFVGSIFAFEKEQKIRLTPNNSDNPKAPNYSVLLIGNKYEPQIGSAWLKHPKKPESKISEFLSVLIDSPDFPNALNIAAFPKGFGKWDVSWRRRQSNNQDAA